MKCGVKYSAGLSSTDRRAWLVLQHPAQSTQRRKLYSAHRHPVAVSACPVSSIPNGPSALPEQGVLRRDGEHTHHAGASPSGHRRSGSQRVLCGRNICADLKRRRQVGKTRRGTSTEIMGMADVRGLSLAQRTVGASSAEVNLVGKTLDERFAAGVPERLIRDTAYDSNRLDETSGQDYCTEMIAPNKVNRRISTQDGHPLRHYVRRWKVERLFVWPFNFHCWAVRYEYHAENSQSFVHLAATVILVGLFR